MRSQARCGGRWTVHCIMLYTTPIHARCFHLWNSMEMSSIELIVLS